LNQVSLALPDRKYYIEGFKNSAYQAYFKLMVDCAKKMGATDENANSDMKEVLELETQLAQITVPEEEMRDADSQYNLINKKSLVQKYENLQLNNLIDYLSGNTFSDAEELNVAVPPYLDRLNDLIPKTKKRTLANYIIWRVVLESLPHLSQDWRDLYFQFTQTLDGSKSDVPRSQFCLLRVSANFDIALSSLYILKNVRLNNKIQQEASIIVNEVIKTAKQELRKIEWMQDSTKQQAIEKLNQLISITAYPKEYLNTKKVDKQYAEV
ncbi:membrane metallo-endopeptidase-like protein 1-like protein, partial [Leptotrombidium deliense]